MAASVESLKGLVDSGKYKGIGGVRKAVAKAKALSEKEKQAVVDYAISKLGDDSAKPAAPVAAGKPRVVKKGKASKADVAASVEEPKRRGRPPGKKAEVVEAPVVSKSNGASTRAAAQLTAKTLAGSDAVMAQLLDISNTLTEVKYIATQVNTAIQKLNIQDNDIVARSAVLQSLGAAVQSLSGSGESANVVKHAHSILSAIGDTLDATMNRYPMLNADSSMATAEA